MPRHLQDLMQFVMAHFDATRRERLLEQQIHFASTQSRNLAPKRKHYIQHQQRVAMHPLGAVLAVIQRLLAYTKQLTQVDRRSPRRFFPEASGLFSFRLFFGWVLRFLA